MTDPCDNVAILLHANGFRYDCQMTLEAFNRRLDMKYRREEYLGWEISTHPGFSIIHVKTRNLWLPLFEEIEHVKLVKGLICKGIKKNLEKAMEGSL